MKNRIDRALEYARKLNRHDPLAILISQMGMCTSPDELAPWLGAAHSLSPEFPKVSNSNLFRAAYEILQAHCFILECPEEYSEPSTWSRIQKPPKSLGAQSKEWRESRAYIHVGARAVNFPRDKGRGRQSH